MKTDLLLVPMGATWTEILEAGRAAERAGFDGLWTWDHFRDTGGAGPTPEAWTVLTALAAAVPRVAVGPLVLNVANRHPGVLANMAATLQEVSGGRLILGLGAGGGPGSPYEIEQRAIGQRVDTDPVRARRTAEAIQVMKHLWRGDTSSFAGEFYRLDRPQGFLRPVPPPPIIVGAFGTRMARLAGQYADGMNTQAFHPQLERLVEVAREAHEAARRAGEPFLVTVFSGLNEAMVRPGSRQRGELERLGVDRLILLVSPPYPVASIAEAGRMLAG